MAFRIFQVGEHVTVHGVGGTFEVVSGPNRRNEFQVSRGALRFWVAGERLEYAPGSRRQGNRSTRCPSKHRGRREQLSQGEDLPLVGKKSGAQEFGQEIGNERLYRIDLHGGLTVREAEELLFEALNHALLQGLDGLEVIHGGGRGKLAEVVKNFPSLYPKIRRIERLKRNQGVTLLIF